MEYNYRGYRIIVEALPSEVHFHLFGNEQDAELLLKALWLPDLYRPEVQHHLQFEEGDYFQHTFNARPARAGLGTVIHDFIIDNRHNLEIAIHNVFSTKEVEDGHGISYDAVGFWEKRVELGFAVIDQLTDRYKILWNEGA